MAEEGAQQHIKAINDNRINYFEILNLRRHLYSGQNNFELESFKIEDKEEVLLILEGLLDAEVNRRAGRV